MLLRNKSNHETGVTSVDWKHVKLAPWQTVQVTDEAGNWFLRNYGNMFEKVETEWDAEANLIKKNKELINENELLKRKVTELQWQLLKKDKKETENEEKKQTPLVEIDKELEELTAQRKEVTWRDKVPNIKKNDKERIRKAIDKQRLLSAK